MNKIQWVRRALSVLFIALGFTSVVQAQQLYSVDIPVSYDSYTDSRLGTSNFGTDTTMNVGVYTDNGTGYYNRAFFYFDLSSIPASATVDDAQIRTIKSSGTWTQEWDVKRVTSTWYEDTITHNDQPDISDGAEYGYWSQNPGGGNEVNFSVGTITKHMHWGYKANYGFVVENLDETDTTGNNLTLYSQECSDSTKRPFLRVWYYYPIELQNVSVVHESDSAAADGSISFDVAYGTRNFSYSWVNSSGTVISTDSILDSLTYGWYGVHITGDESDEIYKGFLVGTEGRAVDIDFRTSEDYTDYAYTRWPEHNGTDFANKNFGNTQEFLTAEWGYSAGWGGLKSYIDFNLWIDPRFVIDKADLTLYGKNHKISNWRTNKAEFNRVTEVWHEDAITYNNSPSLSFSDSIYVDSVSTTTQDNTIDISSFINYWKTNPSEDFGLEFEMIEYVQKNNRKQSYHSPKNATSTNRPLIEFTVDLTPFTTASFADSNARGQIDVDIDDIYDKQGPYHYIISTTEIGDFDELYHYIADTLDFDIDSTDFYEGAHTSTSFDFETLPEDYYYVSVFDSRGKKLMQEQVEVQQDLAFTSQTNLTADGDEVYATGTGAIGEMELYVNTDDDSEIRLEIVDAATDMFFGFGDLSTTLTNYRDVDYGFYFNNSVLYTVQDGNITTTGEDLSVGDVLKLNMSDGTLSLQYNGTEKTTFTPASGKTYKMNVGMSNAAKIKLGKKKYSKLPVKLVVNTSLGSCLGSYGSIEVHFGIPTATFFSYQVDSDVYLDGVQITETSYNATNNTWWYSNLVPGVYQLVTTVEKYLGPTLISTQTQTQWISINSRVNWTYKVESDYEISNEGLARIDNSSTETYGVAQTDHKLMPAADDNILYFKLNMPNYVDWAGMNWSSDATSGNPALSSGVQFIKFLAFGSYPLAVHSSSSPQQIIPFYRHAYIYNDNADEERIVRYNYIGSGTDLINYTSTGAIDHAKGFTGQLNTGFSQVSTNMPCDAPDIYAKVDRKLRGVKYDVYLNKLHFYMDEEYESASGNLKYKIFSSDDRIDTAQDPSTVLQGMIHDHGDNRFELNVTSLSPGVYLLQVENEKAEKFYLRFVK